jgi:HD-like signal output (HDOD) protein
MRHQRMNAKDCEDAYTAGLLHDLGKLMLAENLPSEFETALKLAKEQNIPLYDAEKQVFGATHSGLAGYLFALWGLPAAVVEAVAFHHDPERSSYKKFSALTAVHAANALCNDTTMQEDYLRGIGMLDQAEDWKEVAAEAANAFAE